MFKATVSTLEDGVMFTTDPVRTAMRAINIAALTAEAAADQRVRIGLMESDGIGGYKEVFWAWGAGVADAARQARAMHRKSAGGGGR